MSTRRQFKGVWIPADLYLFKGLSWPEKLIIIEVHSFSANGLPCFVSNEHLSTVTQTSVSTVEKALRRLVADGFLTRSKQKVDGKFTRFLKVNARNFDGLATVKTEGEQPYFLRTTNTNIPNQPKKPKKEREPVSLEVCIEAFTTSGSNENEAHKFYDYYTANGWTQGRQAKPLACWRAAARNWMRRASEFSKTNTANGFNPDKIDASRLGAYIANGAR